MNDPITEVRLDWIAWAGSTGMGLWVSCYDYWHVVDIRAPWAKTRDAVLLALSEPIEAGDLVPVALLPDGGVAAWGDSSSSQLKRIETEWSDLGRRPYAGEICHLVARSLLRRRWAPSPAQILTAIDAASLTEDFLAEEDPQPIDMFADRVRFGLGDEASPALIRTETLAIFGPLVTSGRIKLGAYSDHGFRLWEGDGGSLIERLNGAWTPMAGDNLWAWPRAA